MEAMDMVSFVFLVMGGFTWGLLGACLFDRVATIFDGLAAFRQRIVCMLVGPAAVYATVSVRALPGRWRE